MTDANAGGAGGTNIKKSNGGSGGTDPNNNVNTSGQTLDLSKVGDADFEKIYDDPRLFKHPRFKSLADRAKKADDLEKQQQADEELRLKNAKKFEELAEKRKVEGEGWKSKYFQSVQDNSIIASAVKAGAADTEAVLKLIDRSKVKTGDNDQISGVDEAVSTLLTAKPYLKGKPGNVTIGAGTAPGQGGQDAPKRFKLSQIQDPEFYRKNEKDILQAVKLNLVENDVNQPAK